MNHINFFQTLNSLLSLLNNSEAHNIRKVFYVMSDKTKFSKIDTNGLPVINLHKAKHNIDIQIKPNNAFINYTLCIVNGWMHTKYIINLIINESLLTTEYNFPKYSFWKENPEIICITNAKIACQQYTHILTKIAIHTIYTIYNICINENNSPNIRPPQKLFLAFDELEIIDKIIVTSILLQILDNILTFKIH